MIAKPEILIIGGGMAGCGATYESRYWGRDLKIVVVEKANIERSGAVAQGLYAINCYMGMQWDENKPEDHVRYARNDLAHALLDQRPHFLDPRAQLGDEFDNPLAHGAFALGDRDRDVRWDREVPRHRVQVAVEREHVADGLQRIDCRLDLSVQQRVRALR